jgi:hypothetical protein
MEPEVSLSSLQEPATGIRPERDEFNSNPLIPDLKIHFNIILLSVPRYTKWPLHIFAP